jgi:hypothetical protein
VGDKIEKNLARMGEGRGVYRVLVENQRKSDHWGDKGVDGMIILGWIFKKRDVEVWTGLSCFGIETVAGTCECGNEPLGSIKYGEFLEYLQIGWLLKKDSSPWSKQE